MADYPNDLFAPRVFENRDGVEYDPDDPTRIFAEDANASNDEIVAIEESILSPESWVAPTLLNSWVNYGGGYATAGYMKDALGFVHLKGMVKTGTIGQKIFTLPVGYRPAEINIYAVASYALFGDVYINASGDVTPNVGSSNWVSLSGIIFKAA